MAAGRAGGALLVLAVTTLAGRGDASRSANSLADHCQFTPDLSRAVEMDCDCAGGSAQQISISSEDLPSSIKRVHITNCNGIQVAEDTFSHLRGLQNIHFGDIESLQIDSNDWSRIARPEQVRITVNRTSELVLGGRAFSGWSDPGPRIVIGDVIACSILKDGFSTGSIIQSVALQNIRNLTMDGEAFLADTGQLKLVNVTLGRKCGHGSFSGRIHDVSLHSVTISEVGGGCLHAREGWGSLTVRSSYLGNISELGVTGKISNVTLDDSRLGAVDIHGISLTASTFTMQSVEITKLKGGALDVVFDRSASLQTTSIGSLSTNAFRRLRARRGSGAALTISQVSVDRAESGSLALSAHTRHTLLDVVLRESCDCDADKQALRLVIGDSAPHSATAEQRRTARQVAGQVRCTSLNDTPTLVEFYYWNCPVGVGNMVHRPLMEYQTSSRDLPLSLGLGVPLALALVALAIVARRLLKRGRQRLRNPCGLCDNVCRGKDANQEPMYSEIPGTDKPMCCGMADNVRSSTFPTPSTALSASRPDHPPSLPSEPVYLDMALVAPRSLRVTDNVQLQCPPSASAAGPPSDVDHPRVIASDPVQPGSGCGYELLRPPSSIEAELRSDDTLTQSAPKRCGSVAEERQQMYENSSPEERREPVSYANTDLE